MYDRYGNPVPVNDPHWYADDTFGSLSVNQSDHNQAYYYATMPGNGWVQYSQGPLDIDQHNWDSIDITVYPPAVNSLYVDPNSVFLTNGQRLQFTGTAYDQAGNPIYNLDSTSWATTNGSIEPNGLFTGSPGDFTVTGTATKGGTSAEGQALGQTYYWRVDEVEPSPKQGTAFSGEVWSFSVADYSVAGAPPDPTTIQSSSVFETRLDGYGSLGYSPTRQSSGIWNFTAYHPGSADIQTRVDYADGSVSGTTKFEVKNKGPLSRLFIYPPDVFLPPGGTKALSAGGVDQWGNSTYSPSNPSWTASGGTIDANALYTAPSQSGVYEITASYTDSNNLSYTGTAHAHVGQEPAPFVVDPNTVAVEQGGLHHWYLKQPDVVRNGDSLDFSPMWATDAGVLSVDGRFIASQFGTATIEAMVPVVPSVGADPEMRTATASADVRNYLRRFALWNGFLNMVNILELVNHADEAVTAYVTLYDISGTTRSQTAVSVPAGGQTDVILNGMTGFAADSYGIVKVLYLRSSLGSSLFGRLAFYRSSTTDSYDFAYAVPLTQELFGDTAVTFNTYQPSTNPTDAGRIVSQWLSIVNLDPRIPKDFTVNRYDAAGSQLSSADYSVGPYQRLDIEGGHENPGPWNVGLNEIIPADPNAPYLAHQTRYGEGANGGYAFAFPLAASGGIAGTQTLIISNGGGGDCWVELANAGNETESWQATYRGSGSSTGTSVLVELAAKSQRHLHASEYLGAGATGIVEIEPIDPNSPGTAIAQSMYYFRDSAGSIEAMYGTQGSTLTAGEKHGSYNLFLNNYNWLRMFNPTDQEQDVDVTVGAQDVERRSLRAVTLPAYSGVDLGLHENDTYGTVPDSYGLVSVTGEVAVELLRIRPTAAGGIDYAMPTAVE